MIDHEFTYGERELASEYATFPAVLQTIEKIHLSLTDLSTKLGVLLLGVGNR